MVRRLPCGVMTTYLVRHGSAGSRDAYDPNDAQRHLDDDGKLQRERLTDWLRHEPIVRVLSSPYPRCVETVELLAAELGLEVEHHDALAEGADPDESWQLLAETAGQDVVLCSHGDVIPDLLHRAQLRGLHVAGKSGCAKGSVWTLRHWDGERFATGVYTPIPVS